MAEVTDGPGMYPGFSKEVEALLRLAHVGAIRPSELRNNLRKMGLELGADELPLPDFDPLDNDNNTDAMEATDE